MAISIDNLGAIGMLFDRQPHELPPEAWSSLRNCRCYDKGLWSDLGYSSLMGVPRHVAYYLASTVDSSDAVLWAYLGNAKASATDGTTHTDITRTAGGDYVGTDVNLWNGGNFGGISIFNNGIDVPQAWISPALGTPLVNLANWPANTLAKVVRPLGRVLVALDVTVSGTRKSTLVKWSDEADIGTVPVTWDPADTTKKAGEWPLLETSGACIDMLPLGERGIIYKTDSAFSMTRISGRFVFAFKQIGGLTGILAQRCVTELLNKHIVATPDDVIMHDGFQVSSILDDRMQRWYAGRVDQTNAFRSFIATNYSENEVWICIPETGQKFPNVALVVNVKDGTTTVKDLPAYSHIDYGRPPGTSQTYDAMTMPFDSMVGYFGQSQGNSARKRMVGIVPLAERNQLLQSEAFDSTWALNAVTVTPNVEGVADKITPTVANSTHFLIQSYTKLVGEPQTWTFSVKAKADGYGFLILYFTDGVTSTIGVCFDLATGLVAGTPFISAGILVEASSEPVDANGYRRLHITFETGVSMAIDMYMSVQPTASSLVNNGFTGNGTSGARLKEAQLRRGLYGVYQVTTTLKATTGIFLLDSGLDNDGVAFTSRAERTGLAVIGQTRTGEPKSDFSIKKLLTEVTPKMELLSGTSVKFYAGMQELTKGPVLWNGPFTFTPGTDLNFFPDIEGRLVAIAIETSNREQWRIDGYDLEISNLGKY